MAGHITRFSWKTFNRISRANIVTVVAPPTYPRLRQKKLSIAFLAPISWLVALATSPKFGRLQKIFNCISPANIVTSGTCNTSKVCRLQKISIAFLAPISWLAALATSPKLGRFQSHFSRQYRDQRHSQHLQSLVDFKKFSIAFLVPISWLAALATLPKLFRLQKISIAFLAPISWLAALATSPKLGRFQSHFSRQYRD